MEGERKAKEDSVDKEREFTNVTLITSDFFEVLYLAARHSGENSWSSGGCLYNSVPQCQGRKLR